MNFPSNTEANPRIKLIQVRLGLAGDQSMTLRTTAAVATAAIQLATSSFASAGDRAALQKSAPDIVAFVPKEEPLEKFYRENSIANGTTIDAKLSAYVLKLGRLTTGYDEKLANSNTFNQPEGERGVVNMNIARAVKAGMDLASAQAKFGDYGYFQMNQVDVDSAVQLGIPREIASAMNNASGKGNYTIKEQATAVALYIKSYKPEAAHAILNDKPDLANELLKVRFPSLPGGAWNRDGR